MGTDIYLEYDGKPEDDQVGRISTPDYMEEENRLLRTIFPRKWFYASEPETDTHEYDFFGRSDDDSLLVMRYLEERQKNPTQNPKRFVESMKWVQSLAKFYQLGLLTQYGKKNPQVRVVWTNEVVEP